MSQQRSHKILLIEPSPAQAQRLRDQLARANLQVIWAQSIVNAIQLASEHRPDLILAEIHLPSHAGLNLLEHLQRNPATGSIPVILQGRFIHSEERARALNAGAYDVLTRPVTTNELVARLKAILRTRDNLSALEHKAHRDGLTGLANRGIFDDQLARDWDACHRQGQPLSIILVDLDHFKSINDVHGHAAGDEVLRRVARVLACSARSSDLVARYGGEEFAIVAANCTLESGLDIARRVQEELSRLVIPIGTTTLQVTASIGVACSQNDATLTSPLELVNRADAALYQAKRSGRNAVWMHDPSRQQSLRATAS